MYAIKWNNLCVKDLPYRDHVQTATTSGEDLNIQYTPILSDEKGYIKYRETSASVDCAQPIWSIGRRAEVVAFVKVRVHY